MFLTPGKEQEFQKLYFITMQNSTSLDCLTVKTGFSDVDKFDFKTFFSNDTK